MALFPQLQSNLGRTQIRSSTLKLITSYLGRAYSNHASLSPSESLIGSTERDSPLLTPPQLSPHPAPPTPTLTPSYFGKGSVLWSPGLRKVVHFLELSFSPAFKKGNPTYVSYSLGRIASGWESSPTRFGFCVSCLLPLPSPSLRIFFAPFLITNPFFPRLLHASCSLGGARISW